MRLPVLRGPLRGAWWDLRSGGKIARVLLGTYESEQVSLFTRHVGRGGTFLDVGAHVGFYTLLGARLVGPEGRVWAFEPEPRNARWLREHVRVNGVAHVAIEEAAVAAEDGTARFGGGRGTGTGRLTGAGSLEVRTVALDRFCDHHEIRPTALKVDVEGGEVAVLEGARVTLTTARPVVFLSTHGPNLAARSTALLEELGYTLRPIRDGVATSPEVLGLPEG